MKRLSPIIVVSVALLMAASQALAQSEGGAAGEVDVAVAAIGTEAEPGIGAIAFLTGMDEATNVVVQTSVVPPDGTSGAIHMGTCDAIAAGRPILLGLFGPDGLIETTIAAPIASVADGGHILALYVGLPGGPPVGCGAIGLLGPSVEPVESARPEGSVPPLVRVEPVESAQPVPPMPSVEPVESAQPVPPMPSVAPVETIQPPPPVDPDCADILAWTATTNRRLDRLDELSKAADAVARTGDYYAYVNTVVEGLGEARVIAFDLEAQPAPARVAEAQARLVQAIWNIIAAVEAQLLALDQMDQVALQLATDAAIEAQREYSAIRGEINAFEQRCTLTDPGFLRPDG